jgi:hypothetical protein
MFTFSELQALGSAALSVRNRAINAKAAAEVLIEFQEAKYPQTYDIFLSHSRLDASIILGLKTQLEALGFSVYVYWIEDSRYAESVNRETAERLRKRMRSCHSLLYAASANSTLSKWMPWEVGYFDAFANRVAIVPIQPERGNYFEGFNGQEYLSLYPYVSPSDLPSGRQLYVWYNANTLRNLRDWITNGKP